MKVRILLYSLFLTLLYMLAYIITPLRFNGVSPSYLLCAVVALGLFENEYFGDIRACFRAYFGLGRQRRFRLQRAFVRSRRLYRGLSCREPNKFKSACLRTDMRSLRFLQGYGACSLEQDILRRGFFPRAAQNGASVGSADGCCRRCDLLRCQADRHKPQMEKIQ